MYKLLIADDEPLEREGIRVIIEKYTEDIDLVGKAKNGREAIELTRKYMPDIVFLDIKMPGIDGIDAAREIKSINPDIIIYILTAHDYFEYAKESVAIGINDYLLKPVRKQIIVDKLEEAKKLVDQRQNEKNESLKMREVLGGAKDLIEKRMAHIVLEDLLEKDEAAKHQIELLELDFKNFCVLAIKCQESTDYLELYNEVKSIYKRNDQNLVSLYNDCVYLILAENEADEIDLQNLALKSAETAYKRLKRAGYNVKIGVGFGDHYSELKETLIEARKILRKTDKEITIVHESIVIESEVNEKLNEKLSLVKKIQRGDFIEEESVKTQIDTYFEERWRFELFELLVILRDRFYAYKKNVYFDEPIDLIKKDEDMELIKQSFYREIERYRKDILSINDRIILSSKQYIRNNYGSDITLEKIAQKFAISPHYFSKLFKQETGKNFIEFLTEVRIQEAKERLMNGTSIKEVAIDVGYKDPNYFSRVFKRVTGERPSSYSK
ncbi:MAG: response regulator [Tissierellales bacterium]|jgi:two-component system response regulator YesN|nr:response regulator [Tissierellales bacterium]